MLGLKLPTDPRWINIAEKNIDEILSDHAWCEQKAASLAISLTLGFPEKKELVRKMVELAEEELSHFRMVLDKLDAFGFDLKAQQKDAYVNELLTFFDKNVSKDERLVNQLLYSGLIEARSCERFKLLSENIENKELATFYRELMISEANHYTLFLQLARTYGNEEMVTKKWDSLLVYEASIMEKLGNSQTMHG